MAVNISKLGNNIGKIYITEIDGVTVSATLENTVDEIVLLKRDASSRGPISGEILGTGSVQIVTATAGTISNVDVDGINQLGAIGVVITVGDPNQTALDLADAINLSPPASGPRYTAVAKGDTVILSAPKGSGATLNGDVVGVTATGTSTFVTTNIEGGSDGSGVFDNLAGARYFFNDNVNALEGDITGAEEISKFIITSGLNSKRDQQGLVISSGTVTPSRVSQITDLVIDTESAAAADDLDFIDPTEFEEGDEINIRGKDATQIVTVRDKSIGSGNLETSNDESFSTGTPSNQIRLKLIIDAAAGPTWFEAGRNPTTKIDPDAFFESNLPIPFGHRLEEIFAAGGTINVKTDIPLDKTFLELFTTGNVPLTGNLSVQFTGSPKDGQREEVLYSGDVTLGAFSITIFGIQLSQIEATVGGVKIEAIFDAATAAWKVQKFYDHNKVGLIQNADIADDAVQTTKIKDDAITTVKIVDLNITTAKIQDSSVTTLKINTGAVTLDKIVATLKDTTRGIAVSFETNELGEYRFYPEFKCNLTRYISRLSSPLAAADNGTIQAANGNGNMANGLITHLASAAFGDEQEVSPTTNQDVDPGGGANDHFKFTTAKGTPGGKTNLILFLTRVT